MTYVTIEGIVVDLSGLTDEETVYFQHCVAAYKAGAKWEAFMTLLSGTENPLLRKTGGVITQAVYDNPLYRAVRDMEDRLGIQQGELGWDGGPIPDPFDDEWISASAAAEIKGVSVQAIHGAIQRGDIYATGTTRKQVSRRSLEAWTPVAVRQRAGQARTAKQESWAAEANELS